MLLLFFPQTLLSKWCMHLLLCQMLVFQGDISWLSMLFISPLNKDSTKCINAENEIPSIPKVLLIRVVLFKVQKNKLCVLCVHVWPLLSLGVGGWGEYSSLKQRVQKWKTTKTLMTFMDFLLDNAFAAGCGPLGSLYKKKKKRKLGSCRWDGRMEGGGREVRRMREGVHPWDRGQYFRKGTERNLDGKIDEKRNGRVEEGCLCVCWGGGIELGIWRFLLPCPSCCRVPSRGVYLRYLWSKWITVIYLKAADKQPRSFSGQSDLHQGLRAFYWPWSLHGVNIEVGFTWRVCMCAPSNSCSVQVVAKLLSHRFTSTLFTGMSAHTDKQTGVHCVWPL